MHVRQDSQEWTSEDTLDYMDLNVAIRRCLSLVHDNELVSTSLFEEVEVSVTLL